MRMEEMAVQKTSRKRLNSTRKLQPLVIRSLCFLLHCFMPEDGESRRINRQQPNGFESPLSLEIRPRNTILVASALTKKITKALPSGSAKLLMTALHQLRKSLVSFTSMGKASRKIICRQ